MKLINLLYYFFFIVCNIIGCAHLLFQLLIVTICKHLSKTISINFRGLIFSWVFTRLRFLNLFAIRSILKPSLSPKLKTGYIVMKTSFKTRILRMGLGSFVDINIFVMKHFYSVSSYSPFFSNLLNQNLQNVKTPTRKLESFFQRYYFKFRALAIVGVF